MKSSLLPRLNLDAAAGCIAVLSVPLAFWAGVRRDRSPQAAAVVASSTSTGLAAASIAVLCFRATSLARKPPRVAAVAAGCANLVLVFWFAAIDWVWRYEECDSCMHGRDVFEYRVASIVLRRETRDDADPSLLQLVAADLGVPCAHPRTTGYRLQRWSGLCWITQSQCGLRIAGPAWYPPCARQEVRRWLNIDPGLARTFRERVLHGEDRAYWRTLVARMKEACPPDESGPRSHGTRFPANPRGPGWPGLRVRLERSVPSPEGASFVRAVFMSL